MLVINVTIGDTTEQAKQIARHGHDEYWRFLGPYGRQVNYLDEHGKSWPNTRLPTLEESMQQGPWVIGTAAEVRDNLAQLQQELGIENLVIFPHFPGMVRQQVVDQIERFMADVAPTLRQQAEAIESAEPGAIDTSQAAATPIVSAQAKTRETIAAGRS
jgi:alkanesulfonate monooxygenase SsuD/methylene tetrahydromethanopterin reductase-like flavin-dependent oxidoreductase (luciferase family)